MTCAHASATLSARRRPCRALRKVMGRTMRKTTSWDSDPTTKTIMEAEADLRRGATPELDTKRQRQQQYLSPPSLDDRAPRAALAGLVTEVTPKATTSPLMSLSDPSTKPRQAPRPKTRQSGIQSAHTRRRRRLSGAKRRRMRRKRRKTSNCVCSDPSATSRITAVGGE